MSQLKHLFLLFIISYGLCIVWGGWQTIGWSGGQSKINWDCWTEYPSIQWEYSCSPEDNYESFLWPLWPLESLSGQHFPSANTKKTKGWISIKQCCGYSWFRDWILMILVTLRLFLYHHHQAKGFTCKQEISKSNGQIALVITKLIYSPEVDTFSCLST